jgi:hypothetical protein
MSGRPNGPEASPRPTGILRRRGPRAIGAIAGLVPAALAILLLGFLGALSGRFESLAAALGLAAAAVAIGWLVGPIARGSAKSDMAALLGYTFSAAVAYLIVATVISVSTFVPLGGERTPLTWVADALARFGYGLLYVPFWAAFVSPLALLWVIAMRVLRRRARFAPVPAATPAVVTRTRRRAFGSIRPRRVVLLAVAVVLGYGPFVALLPLMLYDEPRPPWSYERPIALFGLLGVPAVVATIGAVRGVRTLVVAAGVLCIMQAYVAFSGVTIGFVVPGLLLLVLGSSERWPTAPRVTRATLLGGIAVIVLTVGAWIALLGLTAPRCYAFHETADGTRVYIEVPTAGRISVGDDGSTHGSGSVSIAGSGEGCSSAELTPQGIGTAATLAIGAIAIAGLAASSAPRPEPA